MPPQVRCSLLALLAWCLLSSSSYGQSVQQPGLVNPVEQARYEIPREAASGQKAAEESQAEPLAIPFARQVTHNQPESRDASSRESAALPPLENDTLSLAPPSDKEANRLADTSSALPSFLTVLASLSVVLGIFFLFAWIVKKSLPKGTTQLPTEVVEVLGRTLLAPRQYVHLLRVGDKLLLVSMSPSGAETLTEITDPLQVDRMSGLCQKTHPFSSTNAFRQVFQQFGTKGANKDLEIADADLDPPSSLKPAFEQSHA